MHAESGLHRHAARVNELTLSLASSPQHSGETERIKRTLYMRLSQLGRIQSSNVKSVTHTYTHVLTHTHTHIESNKSKKISCAEAWGNISQ